MRRTLIPILALLIWIQMAGCRLTVRNNLGLNRIWFYDNSSAQTDFDSSFLTAANFITLHADGSYTRDLGIFDYGKWKFNGAAIVFISHTGKVSIYRMRYGWPDQLALLSTRGKLADFTGQPSSFSSPNDDPFILANNQWRIPAIHKETDREIANRLINHFHFWEMYFSWGLKDNVELLDVRNTPTLLTIYGNGVVLKSFKQLPDEWKNYFFDEGDCRKANDMIDHIFDIHKVQIHSHSNRFELYISIFQQLQSALQ
ncbi:MAG TPA: hypothetical protein VKR32_12415 [Puia sp.]|nr:hypothetical protein [Puia sp.]